MITFTFRTLGPEELVNSQLLRAQVYATEKGWINRASLALDGREEDSFDEISIHGGAFIENLMVGTFRLIPGGSNNLPVQEHFPVPADHKAVELSRLAVLKHFRKDVAMLGLCRWIFEQAVNMGASHMYALMEFKLISELKEYGFPFDVFGNPVSAYKNSIDYVAVCPVDGVVPGLLEADLGRQIKLAPLFANPFDGELSLPMLYPDPQIESEKEVA
jgi:N-acyl-L-homoserine lactone synthetase